MKRQAAFWLLAAATSAVALDTDFDGIPDTFDPAPNDVSQPGYNSLYKFKGNTYSRFGSVSAAGDVNNDGYADVVVGAFWEWATGTTRGSARVFSGVDGNVLYTFYGDDPLYAEGDYFGAEVSGGGDVNNDGYADVIVTAPQGNTYVKVFSGFNGGVLYTFDGMGAQHAGDVNNDHYDDVIVQSTTGNGSIIIYSGINGSALYTFSSAQLEGYWAKSFSAAGDINQDGYDDIAIGISQKNKVKVFSGLNGAALYSFASGDADRVSRAGDVNQDGYPDVMASIPHYPGHIIKVFSGKTGVLLYTLPGASMSQAGDVNLDGYDDIIAGGGSDWNDESVRIFSGFDGSILHTFVSQQSSDGFGATPWSGNCGVAGVGDMTGDGYPEVIVGAYWANDNGPYSGKAYVYSMGDLSMGDADSDGVLNYSDNCRVTANSNQQDSDRDDVGDVCDSTPYDDADHDGIDNMADNCPNITNANQLDTDGDLAGDACDANQGGTEPVMVVGGRIYATGGDVIVKVLSASAGYTSELSLVSPGPARYIATNRDIGTVVNLGAYPAGSELVFSIYVRDTQQTYYTGNAASNPDNMFHAAVSLDGVATVGFEDLLGGGDQDYNDNMFRFLGLRPFADNDNDGIDDDIDTDDDGDGMPDNWEMQYGLDPLVNDAASDKDGDGISNGDEYSNGTDPSVINTSGPAENDFNGDGVADVLLRQDGGGSGFWIGFWRLFTMSAGMAVSDIDYQIPANEENELLRSDDLDGDGDTDLVMRNMATGGWHFNSNNSNPSTYWNNPAAIWFDLQWRYVTLADFKGDGNKDLLLQNSTTGAWRVFYISDGQNASMALYGLGWDLVSASDFDGDGDADILMRRQSDGYWRMFVVQNGVVIGNTPVALYQSKDWSVQFVTDFDSDGDMDVVMRSAAGNNWRLFRFQGAAVVAHSKLSLYENAAWQLNHLNDVDKDGDEDIVLRSNTGAWRLFINGGLDAATNTPLALYANSQWVKADVVDLNGNGVKDVLLRNTGTGAWRAFLINGGTVVGNTSPGLYQNLNWTLHNN